MVCSFIFLFFVPSSIQRKGSAIMVLNNQGAVCNMPLRDKPRLLRAIRIKVYNGKGKNLLIGITLIIYFQDNRAIGKF